MIEPALHLVATLPAVVTVGFLAYALFALDIGDGDSLGSAGRRVGAVTVWASRVWLVCAGAQIVLAPTGRGLGERAGWIFAAVMALLVVAFTNISWNWKNHFAALVFGGLGLLGPAAVGSLTHGRHHDLSGVGGLILAVVLAVGTGAGLAHLWHLAAPDAGEHLRVTVRRSGILGWIMGAVAMSVAVVIVVTRVSAAPVGGADGAAFAGWAWVLVAACAGFLGAVALGWWLVAVPARARWTGSAAAHPGEAVDAAVAGDELRDLRSRSRLATLLVVAAGSAAVVATIGLAHSVAPGTGAPLRVPEAKTGVPTPGAWTWTSLAVDWRVDLIYGPVAIALAVFYLLGVRRLRARGDDWPIGRTLAWLAGSIGLLVVTCTGINRYAYTQINIHMTLHMLLNLFVPAAFVLGGPVTLLLRAVHARPHGRRGERTGVAGPREWVLLIVHSRYTRWLCQPLVAITVYVATLFGLYFTQLFDWAVRAPWGHEWMTLHFLLTGYLFYWPVIGIDPGTRRLPHVGRLGMLFAIMPFHAFFGVAVMSMSTLLAGDFYPSLGLLDIDGLQAQQRVAGMIAWISGELPLLAVFIALAFQWARSDQRQARLADRLQDRYGDDEFDAYNRMLAEFEEQRR